MPRNTNRSGLKAGLNRRSHLIVAGLYVLIFGLLFVQAIRGVGQYWDWVFPFYSDQIGNFFARSSQAWTNDANGSPLGYSTDYLLRFLISLPGFVPPELLLFFLLLVLFVSGAFVVYVIARKHTRGSVAFLLGLAAFINPVIFYNFTAGYIDYLVSYSAFIYLVYFLLYRYRPAWREAIIVGLLITLIGVQIQQFVVSAMAVALFFMFRSEDFRWKHVVAILGVPVLISLVWLSNFLFGGADLSEISGAAAKASFKGLADSSYLNIFSFSFSKATLISRFYGFAELLLYGLFFAIVVLLLIKARRKQPDDVFLLTFMLAMLFLATGLFQLINLGPISMLYPMFREVGHFAPLIILALIILMARLMPKGVTSWLCFAWLLVVIAISFVKYQSFTQSLDFGNIRQQFAEFKQFGNTHKGAEYRVLAYPFFGQYAFTKFPQHFQDNLPLRNSGHDSFVAFNGQQFVKNEIKPQNFKKSVQYNLLQTLNVDVLRPYNVKYIYDMSGVYESYYERYVSPATYDNDLTLIKNNSDFMQQLLDANPGKLKRVSTHILEIINPQPRIGGVGSVYTTNTAADAEASRSFMEKVFPDQPFAYTTPDADVSEGVRGTVTRLFTDTTDSKLVSTQHRSLTQTIPADALRGKTTVYTNSAPQNLSYQRVGNTVTFYAASSGKLYADGKLIQDNDANTMRKIGDMPTARGQQYYASVNGSIVPITGTGGKLGTIDGPSSLEIFATNGQNQVKNGSFSEGLWQQKVSDCNAYDQKPDIGMKRTIGPASKDGSSLELWAKRHDACITANIGMKPNTSYVLSYDYLGENTGQASYYLRFNNSDNNAMRRSQSIADPHWHSTLQLITTPDGTNSGQLTLHAQASDAGTPAVVRYDNVTMLELTPLGQIEIPVPDAAYVAHDIPGGKDTTFSFTDGAFDYANIVRNGSFEDGPWQSKTTDCNNYDKHADISGSISRDHSDGRQSLQLEATRHTACQYANVSVQPDTDYIVSFDYQGTPAKLAGYYMEFNGIGSGKQEQIAAEDTQWHTFTTKVRVPATVQSVRLYLHAYEDNGSSKNTVRFDNVRLVAVPTVNKQMYVVSQPTQPLVSPDISFTTASTTKRTVHVSGAKAPFVVNLSESYHPGWRLELANDKVGTLPGAGVDAVDRHFQLDGYQNAWYIDPVQLCSAGQQGCTRQADGSYDIDMIAEFVPQRWFEMSRFVSVATLMGVGLYLVVTHQWREQVEEGVYRHPLARRRR